MGRWLGRLWPGAVAAFLAVGAACALPAGRPAVEPFPIAGAAAAIDPGGSLSLAQARRLAYRPAAAFVAPGTASPLRPLIVWMRVEPDPAWSQGAWYFDGSPDLGLATVYVPAAAGRGYTTQTFGMRQPFRRRSVARVTPTLRLPVVRRPLYLRLSIDQESRSVPVLRVVDAAQIAREDARNGALASLALIFVGVSLSLGFANLFVFAFIRERSYLYYSAWMLDNALFAATFLQDSVWKWLWPAASVPEAFVLPPIVQTGAILLYVFARRFLRSGRLTPRLDRFVFSCMVGLLALSLLCAYVLPSAHFGPAMSGRDVFALCVVLYVLLLLVLGAASLRAGNRLARFFLVADGTVGVASAAVAVALVTSYGEALRNAYLGLMVGQSAEGWILFGALAYRLRTVAREYAAEQQRRIVAQAEALAQTRALLDERRTSATDALTGIGNRRAFDQTLAREWERCARSHAPLSLLIADVDYFKAFNDTYGHVLGDDCLRRVAGAFAACATRPGDASCRYGGEEFAVILPETGEDGALAVAREICERVRALQIEHRGSSLRIVSVSVGAATIVPELHAAPSIAELADANLYRAKEAGRNRVATAATIDQAAPVQRVAATALRGLV